MAVLTNIRVKGRVVSTYIYMNNRIDKIEFARAVREIVKEIPCGKVSTYGDIAALAGSPTHARLVGRILSMIGPDGEVPCHRVVNAVGRTAPHWLSQPARLAKEGIAFRPNGNVDLKRHRWEPDSI